MSSKTVSAKGKSQATKLFATRLSKAKFASPATLRIFSRPVQEQLREHLASRTDIVVNSNTSSIAAAASKKSSKRSSSRGKAGAANFIHSAPNTQQLDRFQYWVTFSQALRQFNTMPRIGTIPAKVTNGATRVVPISAIKDQEEHYLLQNHPPFFNTGVGVFSDWKWHRIQVPAMAKFLNPQRATRKLFIDVDACEDSGFTIESKTEPLELKGVCDRLMFCADQMEQPQKIFPIRGLALNPTNGRRYSQPAHDVLVTAALLRGYLSPYWLTENQITRFFRVGLEKKNINDFVQVPGRVAILVKLTSLKKDLREQVLKTFPPPPLQEREGLSVALDGGNWEIVLHQTILQAMSSICQNPDEMELWVSVSTLRYLSKTWNEGAPTFAFVNCHDATLNWQTTKRSSVEDHLRHFLNKEVGPNNWIDQAALTTMKLYNAEATTHPKAILPQNKNLALLGGKSIHHKIMPQLMKHAFENDFLSPIWLSPLDVIRIPNLAIKPGEKPLEISEKNQPRETLFNIDDLEPESVERLLNQYPAPRDSNEKPYIFLVKNWQTILNANRVKVLKNAPGYTKQLWLNNSDIVFLSLNLKPDVEGVQTNVTSESPSKERQKARGRAEGVRRLFNVAQTTDPIRVSALSLMRAC